jgi:hypothetical protein
LPSPMRTRRASRDSPNNFPRSGTLRSPTDTCSTTAWPSHSPYALFKSPHGKSATLLGWARGQPTTMVQQGQFAGRPVLLSDRARESAVPARYFRTFSLVPRVHCIDLVTVAL